MCRVLKGSGGGDGTPAPRLNLWPGDTGDTYGY
jgi:hypothetical protein